MAEVYVVPSGKVYRQLFDAEVQLVHSLARARQRWAGHGDGLLPARLGGWTPHSEEGGPRGALPARVWMLDTPHRSHKPLTVFTRNGEFLPRETEDEIAARDVRNLPDDVVAEKVGSDVVQRVTERRRLKHDAALHNFSSALGQINSDLAHRYQEAGERLRDDLSASDAAAEQLMSRVDGEDKLASMSFEELEAVWSEAENRSESREALIRELDAAYGRLEDERTDRICQVLRTFTQLLESIAYVPSEEVRRLMDGEAMMLNQALVANRRALSRLSLHLAESGLQLEASLRKRWEEAVRAWRGLRREAATRGFREFMRVEEGRGAAGADAVVQEMVDGQREVNEQRVRLLNSLEDLKPPGVTAEAVAAWSSALDGLNRRMDELNVRHVERLRSEFESACRRFLDEVDRCREDLLASGACAEEEEAWELVRTHMLPLVGERQRGYEETIASMETALELRARESAERCQELAAFALGAARLWSRHGEDLARAEGRLRRRAEESRAEHDTANQAKEASLDLVIDQLRQESSDAALEASLQRAISKLEAIEAGYKDFRDQQVAIVNSYPCSVVEELEAYSVAVREYFKSRESPDGTGDDAACEPGSAGDRDAGSTPERRDSGTPTRDEALLAELREERPPLYLCHTELPRELLAVVREMLAWEFCEHSSQWRSSSEQRALGLAASRAEELEAELQLRLHLHAPRSARVQSDVRRARAEELRRHREDAERHCATVAGALADLRAGVARLDARHDGLALELAHKVSRYDERFPRADRPDRLQKLSDALTRDTEAHMGSVRSSLRAFRRHLEDSVSNLRSSNAALLRSFKLFSEGGSFSPDEVEVFRRRLDKLSRQIDAAEGQIAAGLEGLGSKRMEQTAATVGKFEVTVKVMMSDLVMVERIDRALTGAQVRIKTEVAGSNAQSHHISGLLSRLRQKLDACSSPHVDKETVTAADLVCHVEEVTAAVQARGRYLRCLEVAGRAGSRAEGDEEGDAEARAPKAVAAQKPDSRVGFSGPGLWAPSGRAMRQAADDPAIATIRHILRTQRARAFSQHEAQMIEDSQSTTTGPSRRAAPGTPAGPQATGTSARRGRAKPPRPTSTQRASSGSASRKSAKSKQQVFIHKPSDTSHFEGKIDQILWETYDPLLAAIEEYYALYKRKERRGGVARPPSLPESCEACAEAVAVQLAAYRTQAVAYRHACNHEFRQQLTDLETLNAEVPEQQIKELLQSHLTGLSQSLGELRSVMEADMNEWEHRKRENERRLRPALGHPDNAPELRAVRGDETERQEGHRHAAQRHCHALQARVAGATLDFLASLAALSERALLACDAVPTAAEMEATEEEGPRAGRDVAPALPTTRRGEGETDERTGDEVEQRREEDSGRTRTGHARPGPPPPLSPGPCAPAVTAATGEETRAVVTATVTAAKSTRGHRAAVAARDRAHQELRSFVDAETERISALRDSQRASAERWERCWEESLRRVSGLYEQ